MTPEEFRRAEELFHQLVDQLPAERDRVLEAEDAQVARQVRCLLEEEARWGDASFAGVAVDQLLESPIAAREGDLVGPYRLLRSLGEGGMGLVFEAQQEQPVRRRVALKLIKRGMDTRAVVSRFRAERQALALMNHPGIARVFDVGATGDGRPYFAMELVDGAPITTICQERRLPIEARLELFAAVCDAVQHAHQRGVIHRDLKPSNILVREVDDRPQPVVIDFGIAKATGRDALERSLMTVHGAVVGTPDYMSPEQADSGGLDVDTRSDVYSLGVVLYELLTGTRPFPDVEPGPSGWEAHRRRLTQESPRRPSSRVADFGPGHQPDAATPRSLRRRLAGDLDWIVLRCLERDRERRYATVADLAADIRRHLRREPVEAGPPDRLYRISKFVQRHRVAVLSAAVVAIALLAGTLVATVGFVRARAAEREEAAARIEAENEAAASSELADFMVRLFEVSNPGEARGNSVTAREILDRGVERIRSDLEGQPVVQARLMHTMGTVYLQLGLYAESAALLEEAASRRRSAIGANSPELADSLLTLGQVQRRLMRLEDAQISFEEALGIREAVFGDDSPPVGEVLRSLAVVHRLIGETDTALEQLERSLRIAEAHHGPEHRETASVLNNLAVAAFQAGDLDRARGALERSLAVLERDLGPDHPDVGTLVNNLGMIARRQGDNRAAIAYFERDIELSRRVLGSDHPDMASVLRNLGFAHMALGEYEPARAALEESRAIIETALGADSLQAGNAHGVLADLAVREGRWDEAAASAERALAAYRIPENPQQRRKRLRLLEGRARIARLRGEIETARRSCRTAVHEAEALPDPATEAARCRIQLALIALAEGQDAEAAARFEQATSGMPADRATFLDDPSDSASRAAFLAQKGDPEAAFALLDLAIRSGTVDAWIARNPDLSPLQGDPRWSGFTQRLRDGLERDGF
jgi:serine/threonine protein kinase/tetratricopeptide (TPR) repeat protein